MVFKQAQLLQTDFGRVFRHIKTVCKCTEYDVEIAAIAWLIVNVQRAKAAILQIQAGSYSKERRFKNRFWHQQAGSKVIGLPLHAVNQHTSCACRDTI